MYLSVSDLQWLAGWLEGEGSFSLSKQVHGGKTYFYPVISGCSTDVDIAKRAGRILGVKIYFEPRKRAGLKDIYRTRVYGPRAAGWMMTLWSLLGIRRRAAIEMALIHWKAYNNRQRRLEYGL